MILSQSYKLERELLWKTKTLPTKTVHYIWQEWQTWTKNKFEIISISTINNIEYCHSMVGNIDSSTLFLSSAGFSFTNNITFETKVMWLSMYRSDWFLRYIIE